MTAPDLPPPREMPWPVVYVGIGNSDNKLTQAKWAEFLRELYDLVRCYPTTILGWWYSGPAEPWQNACVAFKLDPVHYKDFRAELVEMRKRYRQDSIAWAEAPRTEFL